MERLYTSWLTTYLRSSLVHTVPAGWLEDEPSRLTGRFEIRPAAEQGPIIVCLDTSGDAPCSRQTPTFESAALVAFWRWELLREDACRVSVYWQPPCNRLG